MAAVRCKQSKLRFFFGALYGKKWREDELFHSPGLVQNQADCLLQRYKASSQVMACMDEYIYVNTEVKYYVHIEFPTNPISNGNP